MIMLYYAIVMLCYDYYIRIEVSERIDINICHYWCFLNKAFKFQTYVCHICHDFLMMSMNLSDITILNIKGFNYYCIIIRISKELFGTNLVLISKKNLIASLSTIKIF